jgi:uncharacterized protein YjbJ (UPF0337 family)
MSDNKTTATAKTEELVGAAKEKIGRATDNPKLQEEGIAQKADANLTTSKEGHSVVENIATKVEQVLEVVKDKFNQATGSYSEGDPIQRKVDQLEGKLAHGNSTITPPEQPTTTEKISATIGHVVETVKEAIGMGHQKAEGEVSSLPEKKIDTLEEKLTKGNDAKLPTTMDKVQLKVGETAGVVKERVTEKIGEIKEKLTQGSVPDPENPKDIKQKRIDVIEEKLASGNDTEQPGVVEKIQTKVGETIEAVKEKASDAKDRLSTITTGSSNVPDPENPQPLSAKKMETLEQKLETGNSTVTPAEMTVGQKVQAKVEKAVEVVKEKVAPSSST